jgi:hypothetical protein
MTEQAFAMHRTADLAEPKDVRELRGHPLVQLWGHNTQLMRPGETRAKGRADAKR